MQELIDINQYSLQGMDSMSNEWIKKGAHHLPSRPLTEFKRIFLNDLYPVLKHFNLTDEVPSIYTIRFFSEKIRSRDGVDINGIVLDNLNGMDTMSIALKYLEPLFVVEAVINGDFNKNSGIVPRRIHTLIQVADSIGFGTTTTMLGKANKIDDFLIEGRTTEASFSRGHKILSNMHIFGNRKQLRASDSAVYISEKSAARLIHGKDNSRTLLLKEGSVYGVKIRTIIVDGLTRYREDDCRKAFWSKNKYVYSRDVPAYSSNSSKQKKDAAALYLIKFGESIPLTPMHKEKASYLSRVSASHRGPLLVRCLLGSGKIVDEEYVEKFTKSFKKNGINFASMLRNNKINIYISDEDKDKATALCSAIYDSDPEVLVDIRMISNETIFSRDIIAKMLSTDGILGHKPELTKVQVATYLRRKDGDAILADIRKYEVMTTKRELGISHHGWAELRRKFDDYIWHKQYILKEVHDSFLDMASEIKERCTSAVAKRNRKIMEQKAKGTENTFVCALPSCSNEFEGEDQKLFCSRKCRVSSSIMQQSAKKKEERRIAREMKVKNKEKSDG